LKNLIEAELAKEPVPIPQLPASAAAAQQPLAQNQTKQPSFHRIHTSTGSISDLRDAGTLLLTFPEGGLMNGATGTLIASAKLLGIDILPCIKRAGLFVFYVMSCQVNLNNLTYLELKAFS
jgi:hypothetical protein